MEETKILYHIDDEDTPYLVKVLVPPDRVTLADFKNVLNRPNYKFFFRSMDDDFGVVKEEIVEDDSKLPCFNGRVVSWLVTAEGSNVSDTTSQCTETPSQRLETRLVPERSGDGRPPSFHPNLFDCRDGDTTFTESESMVSSRKGNGCNFSTFSVVFSSSFLRTASFRLIESAFHSQDTLDHNTLGFGTDRACLHASTLSNLGRKMRTANARAHMTEVDFGVQPWLELMRVIPVGLSYDNADRAAMLDVGSPIKLVVAKCWDPNPKGYFTIPRTEPVRPIDPGAWVAHTEAARGAGGPPGPPSALAHSRLSLGQPPSSSFLLRGGNPLMPFQNAPALLPGELRPPSVSTLTSTSSSVTSSVPESERQFQDNMLTVETDMETIVKAMAAPDSGLDVRDRMWLKITIPKAFIGVDVVDWLASHVQGFQDRKEAKKFANLLLKAGLIRHTVNKLSFSEQCYYVFGDLCSGWGPFSLFRRSTGEAHTCGTLVTVCLRKVCNNRTGNRCIAPLTAAHTRGPESFDALGIVAISSAKLIDLVGNNAHTRESGAGHVVSGGSGGGGTTKDHGAGTNSDSEGASQRSGVGAAAAGCGDNSSNSDHSTRTSRSREPQASQAAPQPAPPGAGGLEAMPHDLTGSRQSFRMAMGNPCEFFVDVM
ncbi:unnamed protein product [Ixodes hexagonus]